MKLLQAIVVNNINNMYEHIAREIIMYVSLLLLLLLHFIEVDREKKYITQFEEDNCFFSRFIR